MCSFITGYKSEIDLNCTFFYFTVGQYSPSRTKRKYDSWNEIAPFVRSYISTHPPHPPQIHKPYFNIKHECG